MSFSGAKGWFEQRGRKRLIYCHTAMNPNLGPIERQIASLDDDLNEEPRSCTLEGAHPRDPTGGGTPPTASHRLRRLIDGSLPSVAVWQARHEHGARRLLALPPQ